MSELDDERRRHAAEILRQPGAKSRHAADVAPHIARIQTLVAEFIDAVGGRAVVVPRFTNCPVEGWFIIGPQNGVPFFGNKEPVLQPCYSGFEWTYPAPDKLFLCTDGTLQRFETGVDTIHRETYVRAHEVELINYEQLRSHLAFTLDLIDQGMEYFQGPSKTGYNAIRKRKLPGGRTVIDPTPPGRKPLPIGPNPILDYIAKLSRRSQFVDRYYTEREWDGFVKAALTACGGDPNTREARMVSAIAPIVLPELPFVAVSERGLFGRRFSAALLGRYKWVGQVSWYFMSDDHRFWKDYYDPMGRVGARGQPSGPVVSAGPPFELLAYVYCVGLPYDCERHSTLELVGRQWKHTNTTTVHLRDPEDPEAPLAGDAFG